jgi:hypothetical protein
MRISSSRAALAGLLASLGIVAPASAANFTYNGQQGSGDTSHWNATIWQPGGVAPSAGNTYELLVNSTTATRLRSPNGSVDSGGNGAAGQTFTFPGDSLTLNGAGFTTGTTSTELRFKATFNNTTFNFPGVGGNPGLILNGGILNDGDDRILTISGLIRANAGSTSSINPGGGGVTDISAARGFLFTAGLSGSGNLTLDYAHDTTTSGATLPALRIDSSNPLFTGDWILNSGWLKAAGLNSLGFGDISLTSVQGPSTLDFDYNYLNPVGSLTLAGATSKLVVDQDLTFGAVTINGTPLAAGTYTAAQLNSSFDANIVDGGTGTLTVVPEPSVALAIAGGIGVLAIRRRRV